MQFGRSLLLPTISFSLRFLFDISIYVVATAAGTGAIVGQLKSVFIGTKWVAINFSDCNIFKHLLYCFFEMGMRRLIVKFCEAFCYGRVNNFQVSF